VLDKAEYSAFQSTLNSPIVSYRISVCEYNYTGCLFGLLCRCSLLLLQPADAPFTYINILSTWPCVFFNYPSYTNLTIGQRVFSWSSILIWNSIPLYVLLETLLPSVHSNAG